MRLRSWLGSGVFALFGVLLGSTVSNVLAAEAWYYSDRTAFELAVGGEPLLEQNFSGYSHDTPLSGVEVLSGISVTTNMAELIAFDPIDTGNIRMFGLDTVLRETGTAYYEIAFSSPYRAFGFDITGFDPTTPGPGIMDVYFSDSTSTSLEIYPTNPTESDPLFFGVIGSVSIDHIRWSEGPESDGAGSEETSLDNFVAAVHVVPEPSSWALMLTGLLSATIWKRKRRRS